MSANNELVYLACPYSDPDPKVREKRLQASIDATRVLIGNGYRVFNPLTHSAPIDDEYIPDDYWYELDLMILARCDRLMLLMLPGWSTSKGVRMELELAIRRWIPIRPLEPRIGVPNERGCFNENSKQFIDADGV